MDITTTTSLKALDLGVTFNGIEHLAIIVLVGVITKVLLDKSGWFTQNLKTLVWILVAVWSFALVVQYTASTYEYVHTTRPFYAKSQHSSTGL